MMTAEKVAEYIYNGVVNRTPTLILTTEGKLAVFLSKFFPKFISKMIYNKMAKEPNTPLK